MAIYRRLIEEAVIKAITQPKITTPVRLVLCLKIQEYQGQEHHKVDAK